MPVHTFISTTTIFVGVIAAGSWLPLAAQVARPAPDARPVEVRLAQEAIEVSHAPGTSGLHAVFVVTNDGADTTTYMLRCRGLGQVRCAGLKHREVTLPPGQSAEVVAFYEVADAGHGVLVVTASRQGGGSHARGRLPVRVR